MAASLTSDSDHSLSFVQPLLPSQKGVGRNGRAGGTCGLLACTLIQRGWYLRSIATRSGWMRCGTTIGTRDPMRTIYAYTQRAGRS